MLIKSKTKTLHKRKRQIQKNIEDGLDEWILMNRSLGILATLWEVIIKAFSLDESLKLKMSIHYKTGVKDFEEKHANFPFRY